MTLMRKQNSWTITLLTLFQLKMNHPIELKLELDDVNYLIDLLDIDSHLSYEDDLSYLGDVSKRLRDEIQLQTYL